MPFRLTVEGDHPAANGEVPTRWSHDHLFADRTQWLAVIGESDPAAADRLQPARDRRTEGLADMQYQQYGQYEPVRQGGEHGGDRGWTTGGSTNRDHTETVRRAAGLGR